MLKLIHEKIKQLGYIYEPAPLEVMTFHSARRVGNLLFTSGQIPAYGDQAIKGRVGDDVSRDVAFRAAEICAFNCVRAAGSIVALEDIVGVVKVVGMVNAAEGFDQMSEVINGASQFFTHVFGEAGFHARTAVGNKIPANWAVEVEAVFEVK